MVVEKSILQLGLVAVVSAAAAAAAAVWAEQLPRFGFQMVAAGVLVEFVVGLE